MPLINIDTDNKTTSVNNTQVIEKESEFSDDNSVIAVPSFYSTNFNSIQPLGIVDPCDSSCQCTALAVEYCTEHGPVCTNLSEAVDCQGQSESCGDCQTSCQCSGQSNQCSICEYSCQSTCQSTCQCSIQLF